MKPATMNTPNVVHYFNQMKRDIIDNKLGNLFMPPQMGFGLVFIGIGIAVSLSGGFAGIGTGLFIFIIGSLICFSNNGIQIDLNNRMYKKYIRLFYRLKIGKWKNMNNLNYITVKKSNKGYIAISLTVRRLKVNELKFDIIILNSNYQSRLLINTTNDKETAYSFAKEIANKLDLKFLK